MAKLIKMNCCIELEVVETSSEKHPVRKVFHRFSLLKLFFVKLSLIKTTTEEAEHVKQTPSSRRNSITGLKKKLIMH